MKKIKLIMLGIIFFVLSVQGSSIRIFHDFGSGSADGTYPYGSMILSGSTLYGMTRTGSDNLAGTIFKIETNGNNYSLLYKFNINTASYPEGSLILSGTMLYGMTINGGQHDQGAIFAHATGLTMGGDFNHDGVTDLLWRRYALGGSNTIWMMSEATIGAALEGEGEREEGSGWEVEGEENNEVQGAGLKVEGEEENRGNDREGYFVGAGYYPAQDEFADIYESTLPEGEGMSAESPLPEYPGPFGAISVLANVPLVALDDLTWKIVGTGDFNSDGSIDILWRYNGTGGSNAVWLMDYIYKISSVAIPALSSLNWEIAGTGDFNSDKKVDILWRNKTSGSNAVWLMDGLSKTGEVNLPAQTNLTWKIVGCGDFNNNGKTDILWRYQGAGGGNQVWLMNGTTRQSIVNIKAETNLSWKIAGVGDFNKDGKADIIWRSSATGGANRIWIMNNTAYARTETLPAVADLNWKIEN